MNRYGSTFLTLLLSGVLLVILLGQLLSPLLDRISAALAVAS